MKASVNGIDINYVIEGAEDAPVVTMSNSLATTHRMWDPQAERLRQRYRVLRYDTRGHGDTAPSAGEYTMEQLADDALGLLQSLGIRKTHFIGLSMGGMTGQILALNHPDMIESLVLADTSHDMAGRKQMWTDWIALAGESGMAPIADALEPRWFTEGFITSSPDVVEPVTEMILSTPVEGFVGCCHALRGFSLGDRVKGIAAPTRIIVGEKDGLVEVSQVMQSLIPGAKLDILERAAHLSNLEQPGAFNAALRDFYTNL
ncbi:MAG: 3-oxoadipate enol-lactonase [Alphaproteobacteria bacterium]